MIAAAIFNKTAHCRSLSDFLFFKGLNYFLLEPSVLSKSNACEGDNKRKRKRENVSGQNETEHRLIQLPLNCDALQRVPFFDLLILVTNYTFFSILVYIISDVYCLLFPESKEINTSTIWISGAFILQIHILTKISVQKVASRELFVDERNTLLCASAIFFLIAFTFCAFSDKIVDLDFGRGYEQFFASLSHYLLSSGFGHIDSNAHSPIMFMVSISLLYSVVASAMFFPVLQYSSLYMDSDKCGAAIRFLLHVTFLAPLGIVLLYLRPMVEHLTENEYFMYAQLRMVRFVAVFFWAILRLSTTKVILRTFLNQPKDKISEYARDRLNEENCQRKVAHFASYACVTSLQYVLPVFITLSATLLLRSLDRFAHGETEHQTILNVILSHEVQEPLWKFASIMLLSTQFLVGVVGIVGKRTF
uniref:Gustatory receptor n=1 Tax=Globodera rostochiensis TaxID=31243 RepID=A0A914HIF5_GLORO